MLDISVIIPTYNRVHFLQRAIHSVSRQTVSCREIVVVDDGSTDATAQMVSAMQQECTIELRYFWKKNSGPAGARNFGIAQAKGDLLAFLDSDDHWHRKKLEIQGAALRQNPHLLVSHTREKWLRRGLHLNQKNKHLVGQGDIFVQSLQLCAVGMSTVMVRRELFDLIGLFDPELPCCEDYDFWLRASCRFPFLLIEQALTTKEGGRDDQVSVQHRVGMDRYRIHALRRLLESDLLTSEQRSITVLELQKKCNVYGRGCIKHGRVEEGAEYLSLATRFIS